MALLEKKTIELSDGVQMHITPSFDDVVLEVGGKMHRIKKTELYGVCFLMADPDTQAKLMPVRQTEMMTFERFHRVEAKRDIKKGDTLRVRCNIDVPVSVAEGLAGMVKLKTSRSEGGIPLIG